MSVFLKAANSLVTYRAAVILIAVSTNLAGCSENEPSSQDDSATAQESKQKMFNVSGTGLLTVDCVCDVSLVKGDVGAVKIEMDIDPKAVKNYQIGQNGNDIFVREKSITTYGGTVISSSQGSVVISGGFLGNTSISASGGRIIVNGVDVTKIAKPVKTSRFIITIPENENLDANFRGESNFKSSVDLNNADLSFQGGGKAELKAKNAQINVSGSSDASLHILGGDLGIDISGSGNVIAEGSFKNVRANITGAGDVNTKGEVLGDYSGTVTGSGDISHTYGHIRGNIRQRIFGAGNVHLVP